MVVVEVEVVGKEAEVEEVEQVLALDMGPDIDHEKDLNMMVQAQDMVYEKVVVEAV